MGPWRLQCHFEKTKFNHFKYLERNLEQMRAIDNGEKIYAIESCGKFHLGVDTEADLQEARRLAKLIG